MSEPNDELPRRKPLTAAQQACSDSMRALMRVEGLSVGVTFTLSAQDIAPIVGELEDTLGGQLRALEARLAERN